jgi:hypothetical protein
MTIQRTAFPPKDVQWFGQSVYRVTGPLSGLPRELPTFTREKFTYENALNEYLDMIVREPDREDDRRVPVATVSKRYALIQHTDAVTWLSDAFKEHGWDVGKTQGTVWLSEYGERMRVQVPLPIKSIPVAVNDVISADVLLWNSVDKSRSFELAIRWMRLVCTNGMTIPVEDRLRKVHNADWMAKASPVEFLNDRLTASAQQVTDSLQNLMAIPLASETALSWIDGDVAKQCGKFRAARLLHILNTGSDCAVGKATEAKKPSELEVTRGERVPGAPDKAASVYDAYQALLWLAGKEKSVERQESLADEAASLATLLLPESQRRRAAAS